MGNQGTASSVLRQNAAAIRAGMVGKVQQVHVWTNRPIWPQGIPRNPSQTPPPNLHWDLWLGPAPARDYAQGYHTFAWRGWWDFGTGALGDMACHTMNMPFMALDLRNPKSVQAQTGGHNRDSFPAWSIIQYEFPRAGRRDALTLTWYDGGKLPPAELLGGETPSSSGYLIIGDKGRFYSGGDYGAQGKLIGGTPMPDARFVESPGHFAEFALGIKGGPTPVSNFPRYAGPLTETVLLGNLAVWADGKKIEWDARRLRAKNAPEVRDIIRRPYREGYKV
jgi:predicted dehydrogenase